MFEKFNSTHLFFGLYAENGTVATIRYRGDLSWADLREVYYMGIYDNKIYCSFYADQTNIVVYDIKTDQFVSYYQIAPIIIYVFYIKGNFLYILGQNGFDCYSRRTEINSLDEHPDISVWAAAMVV
jgi:hypothetical protein